jgi:hypothetical protein
VSVRSLPLSRVPRTNRAQVMLMDRLEADFPDLSWLAVYKAVAAARIEAARELPDVVAYSLALDRHARALLTVAAQRPEASSYLSGVTAVEE